MEDALINKIIALVDRKDRLLLDTADKEGVPHMTTVYSLPEAFNDVFFITH
jgi:hypothetical protein